MSERRYEPCPLCGGSGMKPIYRPSQEGPAPPYEYVGTLPCDLCKGVGQIIEGSHPLSPSYYKRKP